jgi:hypothetical protein
MKKSKRMILYLFALSVFAGKAETKTFAYIDLYRLLPLASSTVRGIIMEFLSRGLIEEKITPSGKAFQISKTGLQEAVEVFGDLQQEDTDTLTMLISRTVEPSLEMLRFFSLRPGVYIRFGSFDRIELRILPKAITTQLLICSEVKLEEVSGIRYLLATPMGQETVALHKDLYRSLTALRSIPGRKNSRISKPQALLLEKSFALIIEILSRNSRIPDSYLPSDIRTTHLLRLFYSAVVRMSA